MFKIARNSLVPVTSITSSPVVLGFPAVRVVSTVACSIDIQSSSAATIEDVIIFPNEEYFFSVQVGAELTVIGLDADGTLYLSEGSNDEFVSGFNEQDLVVKFVETPNVSIGGDTIINTYTAPANKISFLLNILTSGGNRAQYSIYEDAILIDKQYANVTTLSALFDYKTGAPSTPGKVIPVGSTIEVKVVNSGTTITDYNSRLLILEVT